VGGGQSRFDDGRSVIDSRVDADLGEKLFLLMCNGAAANTAARNLGLLTATIHGRRVITEMYVMHLVMGEFVVRMSVSEEAAESIMTNYWRAHRLRQQVQREYVSLASDFDARAPRYREQLRLAAAAEDAAPRMAAFTLTQAGVDVHKNPRALACALDDANKLVYVVLAMLHAAGRIGAKPE
jgi:hypothetical protein